MFLKQSVRVSRGAEGSGRVRGVKMHHGKISDGSGKKARSDVSCFIIAQLLSNEGSRWLSMSRVVILREERRMLISEMRTM
jgi:hypothetical protein